MIAFSGVVPAAGTVTGDPLIVGSRRKNYINFQSSLTYGAGGTSISVYLQTSLDGGVTWRDMANHSFLLASLNKASAISAHVAAAAAQLATDGTLAGDTINQGLIGQLFRVKFIVVGTYTTSSLRIDFDWHDVI